MYRRADELLTERDEEKEVREVHVISSKWNDFNHELQIYDGESPEILDMEKIDFNVSDEKICVGGFEDGYTPCPDERVVDKFRQCGECAPEEIPKLECIFEPQDCEGCSGGFCEETHAVYLAFHGIVPKIGMTSKDRLRERLIEQGADAYALLSTVEDRKTAREEEMKLSGKLGISQRVSSKKKLKRMARKLDKKIVERKYRGVKNRVPVGELVFLEDYPIELPLRAKPRVRSVPGPHSGKTVGIKGEFLIYENSGLQALKISNLVGRKMLIKI
ncbi:MAG: DUF2797 domain-containing protein [Candidatus Thermoplasmatota archaeon]